MWGTWPWFTEIKWESQAQALQLLQGFSLHMAPGKGPQGPSLGLLGVLAFALFPTVFLLIWASCQDVLEWSRVVTPLELSSPQTLGKMVAHKPCSGNLSWHSTGHIWLTWLRALRNRSQSPCGWRVYKPVLRFVCGTSSCVTLSILLTLFCASFSSSTKCEAW